MCYAIPGKVVAIENDIAIVDYFGEKRKAHNEMKNLNVGEYIYAQGLLFGRFRNMKLMKYLPHGKNCFLNYRKLMLVLHGYRRHRRLIMRFIV